MANETNGDAKISVLNPVGYPPKITPKPMAPRLGSLDGKTLYLVDPRFDDSGLFLRQVQNWFAEHMPSVKTKPDFFCARCRIGSPSICHR